MRRTRRNLRTAAVAGVREPNLAAWLQAAVPEPWPFGPGTADARTEALADLRRLLAGRGATLADVVETALRRGASGWSLRERVERLILASATPVAAAAELAAFRDEHVRSAAIRAVGICGEASVATVEVLSAALRDGFEGARREAVAGLAVVARHPRTGR